MLNPIYLSPCILVSTVTLKVSGETIRTTRCNFHPWAVRLLHRERLPRIPSPGRFVPGTKANFVCKTESCSKPVKLNWHASNFSLYIRTQQKFVLFVRLYYACAISRYRERMTLIFLFHRRSTRGERGRKWNLDGNRMASFLRCKSTNISAVCFPVNLVTRIRVPCEFYSIWYICRINNKYNKLSKQLYFDIAIRYT